MRGAVPWPSRSSGTKAAPSRRRSVTDMMAGRLAVDHDIAVRRRQPFAGQRREQFVLAVAGDAGDAENFAAFDLDRDVRADACRADRRAQATGRCTTSRGTVVARAACRFHLADIGADHHARQRRRGFGARIAGRDLLAGAQDGRGVAQPFHLIELVADVEHRAALALEPFQHDEELIGFLRRQHRGRLVENQQLRILHQRAHDLDALALADRQPPDLALRIERQAVVARDLREPRRHVGKAFFAVEAERDVLGDRQIVEQREMLEHHADAKRRAPPTGRPARLCRPSSAVRRRSAGSGRTSS